jgi:hypothetical protein
MDIRKFVSKIIQATVAIRLENFILKDSKTKIVYMKIHYKIGYGNSKFNNFIVFRAIMRKRMKLWEKL